MMSFCILVGSNNLSGQTDAIAIWLTSLLLDVSNCSS